MEKRVIIVLLLINIVLLVNSVLAISISKVKFGGKEYEFELLSTSQDKATIRINNQTRIVRTIQSSPYTPELLVSTMPELRYALTALHHPGYAGDVRFVNLLVLFEKNLSVGSKVSLSFEGDTYDVKLVSTSSSAEAVIDINGISKSFTTIQSSPPYSVDYMSTSAPSLRYVLTSINHPNSIKILLGVEVNLLIECTENWSCSDWSPCLNNQQTRVCNDLNQCGSKKNMSSLNQSCSGSNTSQTPLTSPNLQTPQPFPNSPLSNRSYSCRNECKVSGAKRCFDKNSFQSCGDFNADNCTEWSAPVSCSDKNTTKFCIKKGECSLTEGGMSDIAIMIIAGSTILISSIILIWILFINRK